MRRPLQLKRANPRVRLVRAAQAVEMDVSCSADERSPLWHERISEEILADLESLQTDGPTAAEFATAVEQLGDELELIDNRLLGTALITAHLYPDQAVADLADSYPAIDDIAPEQVREPAAALFGLGQRIEVRQVPRG